MTRLWWARAFRLVAAVAVTAAGTLTVVAAAEPAVAAAGYCPDANGVTVVVDYQGLGGGTVVRCAPGGQSSGLAALENAGFTVTGTSRWGKAFVCRINGKPGPGSEPCIDTPPATAYWSYWYASNGGSWTYSSLGVTSRKPPAGSFEGWSFSLNRTEGTAPRPRVAPRRPTPQPPAPAPGTSANPPRPGNPAQPGNPALPGSPAQPRNPTQPGNPTRPGSQARPGTSTGPGNPAASGSTRPGDPTASAGDTTTEAGPDVDSRASAIETGGGPPAGFLAGAGLVIALAVAGGVTWWRRRDG